MAEEKSLTTGRVIDFVARDDMWKDYVRTVTRTQIEGWPREWSWTIEEYNKMYDAIAGKRAYSPYDWSRWNQPVKPLQLAPETGAKRKIKGKRPLGIFLPPIAQLPAKPNIPVVTSGWYGYLPKIQGRSIVSDRQRWCERRGQRNLPRVFGWPDVYD